MIFFPQKSLICLIVKDSHVHVYDLRNGQETQALADLNFFNYKKYYLIKWDYNFYYKEKYITLSSCDKKCKKMFFRIFAHVSNIFH